MDHQAIGNHPNRRNFLKQSALSVGAFAGLASFGHPLLAASEKASRIEALELLVLQRNREQRALIESDLEHRRSWVRGFSGHRLRTGTGRCRQKTFDRYQSLCRGSHLVKDAAGRCPLFASHSPGLCDMGSARQGNR